MSDTPKPASKNSNSFPKKNRLLRHQDFRRVYDGGRRFSTALFAAFYLERAEADGPRIGFTLPRAVGKAVKRNRIKRRMREALRLRLPQIGKRWDIVLNPRRTVLDAEWEVIGRDLDQLVAKCGI